jgi:hypothetical protein
MSGSAWNVRARRRREFGWRPDAFGALTQEDWELYYALAGGCLSPQRRHGQPMLPLQVVVVMHGREEVPIR